VQLARFSGAKIAQQTGHRTIEPDSGAKFSTLFPQISPISTVISTEIAVGAIFAYCVVIHLS
jgi:hypothetical protein